MYLINEVSRMVDLSQKRIREYEKEGFIKPIRAPHTNNRLYSDFEVAQIKRINYLIHKKGLTVAGIRSLLALAPCWNIFDCPFPPHGPAYQHPHDPCWEVRKRLSTPCPGPCERCPVYLNRHLKPERLLEKEYPPP